jgi:gliding motility-associated-like protein
MKLKGGMRLVVLTALLPFISLGQNLVSNPSFENVSTCAVGSSPQSVNATVGWMAPTGVNNTPEIFNTCFAATSLQPPSTFIGFSYPYSGNAMAGLAQLNNVDYRELLTTQLISPLSADSAYCVSFWVKRSDYCHPASWSRNLSVLFSESPVNPTQTQFLEGQIQLDSLWFNDLWINVEGSFIAAGGEQTLNIGFFGPLDAYSPDENGIYYFIDDVNVQTCNRDSLYPVYLNLPNVLTPNYDQINDEYIIDYNNLDFLEVAVIDRWGTEIAKYNGLTNVWDGRNSGGEVVTDGVYFVRALAVNIFGETMTKQQFVQVFSGSN